MAQIDDLIFKFAFGCAMVDAVGQKAYPHYVSGTVIDEKGKEKTIYGKDGEYIPTPQNELATTYPDIIAKVKELVDQVLGGHFTNQADYDKEFVSVAMEIKAIMKKGDYSEFTFGNIQKLINMTMKHIYIMGYNDPAIRKEFAFCHCPIDSRIAKALVQIKYGFTPGSPDFTSGGTLRASILKKIHPLAASINSIACSAGPTWSSLNSEADIQLYLSIQEEIRNIRSGNPLKYGANSLEFDYFVW